MYVCEMLALAKSSRTGGNTRKRVRTTKQSLCNEQMLKDHHVGRVRAMGKLQRLQGIPMPHSIRRDAAGCDSVDNYRGCADNADRKWT